MRMKSPISIGIISFVFVFLGLLVLPGIGDTLYQRWFYHTAPTFIGYVPLLLILSLLIASMIGAIFFVASNVNQLDSLMPWLLIFWTPVFVVVMEGINWDNQLVHLIYSLFAGEQNGLANVLTIGVGLLVSYVSILIILHLISKSRVNLLTISTNNK